MRHNRIVGSGKAGVIFRDENRGKDFWANRNTLEHNIIENSGGPDGIAIDNQGNTKDIQIIRNEIRETRQPLQGIGIRIGADCQRIQLAENRFSGLSQEIVQV